MNELNNQQPQFNAPPPPPPPSAAYEHNPYQSAPAAVSEPNFGQAPPLLVAEHLSKRYGHHQALDDVNIVLPRGKIIGLLGPNGSGKSTLLKLACGLIQPSGGRIMINGHQPGVETKAITAYLPEKTYLNDWMKVSEMLKFFKDFYLDFDLERATEMLEILKIDPKYNLKSLSKGTQEKVQLILVMSRKAQLYLLDEPIGGVDPAARDYIISTILTNYNHDASVLISTHLITDIEQVLDEVIFLDRSRIVLQETVDNLRDQHGKSIDAMFREVFRC